MYEINEYIEFEKGKIPLILSVPHGGTLECKYIPQRINGVLGIDKGTIELAKDLIKQIGITFNTRKSGYLTPSYIISKVRRSKIDINRSEHEAYNQNSFIAREIYWFYHNKIQEWILENLKSFNHSVLIDIHGFEKDARPAGFRDVDLILGTNNLESLFSETIKRRDWEKNIRGKIVQQLLQLDIQIAPGHPRRKEYVLSGGHITTQYGASSIPKSQAIQIEFSDQIRLFDENLKNLILKTLAYIICEHLNESNYMKKSHDSQSYS
jgi:N-formylglutamate amidohydrolase